MIKLFGFGPCFGVMDASPFVVKVDAFLRMASLPYENIAGFNNIKKSPKGKLPFIVDERGDENVVVPDSEEIIEHLTKVYNVELDNFLTDEQKATAHLVTKSLDENLYWCLVYSRWMLDDTWPIISDTFFGQLPFPVKLIVPKLVRKSVKKNLHGQGTGRHSKDEILAISKKSFDALSSMLGDKPYFFGEQVSSFDAVVYSHICEFISVDFYNEFNSLARKYENLVKFCERIATKYY